jgi:hypothetical protein
VWRLCCRRSVVGRACHYKRSKKNALFHRTLDGAVLKHFDVVWDLSAGLDGDDVEILYQRRLVFVNDSVSLAGREILKGLREGCSVIVWRESQNGDIRRTAPLKTTQVFFCFLDLQTTVDVQLVRQHLLPRYC